MWTLHTTTSDMTGTYIFIPLIDKIKLQLHKNKFILKARNCVENVPFSYVSASRQSPIMSGREKINLFFLCTPLHTKMVRDFGHLLFARVSRRPFRVR